MKTSSFSILCVAACLAALYRVTLAACNIPAASRCGSIFNAAFRHTDYSQLCTSYKTAVICVQSNIDRSRTIFSNICFTEALTTYTVAQFVSNSQRIDQCCGNVFWYSLRTYWNRNSYPCTISSSTTSTTTSPTTSASTSDTTSAATLPVSSTKPSLDYWMIGAIGSVCGALVCTVVVIAVMCMLSKRRHSQSYQRSSHAANHNAGCSAQNQQAISTVDISAQSANIQDDAEYFNDIAQLEHYHNVPGPTDNPPALPARRQMSPPVMADDKTPSQSVSSGFGGLAAKCPPIPPHIILMQQIRESESQNTSGAGRLYPEIPSKGETPQRSNRYASNDGPSRRKAAKLPPVPPNVLFKQQIKESERRDESGVGRLGPDISYEIPEPLTPTAPALPDENPEEFYGHIW